MGHLAVDVVDLVMSLLVIPDSSQKGLRLLLELFFGGVHRGRIRWKNQLIVCTQRKPTNSNLPELTLPSCGSGFTML